MKKIFSSSAILLASTFLVAISLHAQKSVSKPSFKNVDTNLSTETENTGAEKSVINSKALKSFNRNYKTSANVNWAISGELIQASFKEDGKQNRVFYRPNGRWFRTIITYDETLLKRYIKSLVKRNYWKYDITTVTEVHEGGMDCYFINIETAKDFKQVIVYDGEVFVHKEYTK